MSAAFRFYVNNVTTNC